MILADCTPYNVGMARTELSTALAISGARPHATVLLRHDLPDSSHHFDWMIAIDPSGDGPLLTFRLARRLDQLGIGDSLPALQLADHRREYLEYEGPVSDGRGTVSRVCRGEVVAAVPEAASRVLAWELAVEWHEGASCRSQRVRLVRSTDGEEQWQITAVALPSTATAR